MRLTYPKFTPVTKKTNKPIIKILAILWHTLIPIILTYTALKTNNSYWLIPILGILLVRLPEEE